MRSDGVKWTRCYRYLSRIISGCTNIFFISSCALLQDRDGGTVLYDCITP